MDVVTLQAAKAAANKTFHPLANVEPDAEAALTTSRVRNLFTAQRVGLWMTLGLDGTTYSFVQGIGGGRCWRVDLRQETTNPGSYALHQLDTSYVGQMLVGRGPGTRTGTYTTNTNSAAYGGNYYYTTTAGDTVTFTATAGSTAIGLRLPMASNGGVWKVAVDGSATAANLLPTAQNLVDLGILASTVLVANGGTLNPTDRVLDTYQGTLTYDVAVTIADNLGPAAHTVTLTATTYKNTASSAARCYIAGVADGNATTTLDTSNAWPHASHWLNQTIGSAWEDAILALPAGATTPTFIGNVHGYEVQDSLTITDDFATVTFTAGQVRAAVSQFEVTRTSHLLHPDTGATQWATKSIVYTLSRAGLAVTPTTTVTVDTTVTAWWAMCPSNNAKMFRGMDRGALQNVGSVLTFNASGDTYYGSSKSAAAWVWASGGYAGMLAWINDIGRYTNGWANSGNYTRIEDRGSINPKTTKIYFPFVDQSGAALTAPAGTVKTWTMRYQAGYFAPGADTVLTAETAAPHTDAVHTDGPHQKYLQQIGTLIGPVAGSTNTMQVANDCWIGKIIPSKSITVTKLVWFTGSATSGNYDVGIFDAGGNRLWSKGSTAWPAINTEIQETVTGVTLTAGVPVYVAFAHDNTTGTVRAIVPSFTGMTADDAGNPTAMRFASSFPIPATLNLAAPTGAASRVVQMFLRSA